MCQNMNKNTLILCLLPIIVGAHLSVRYQSVKDSRVYEATTLSRTEYLGSIGSCATLCTQIGNECEVFSSKYIDKADSEAWMGGYKCEFAFSNYSGYTTGSSGWYLWSKKTSVQSARSVTTLTPTTPEPECPVVWRQWRPDDSSVGVWSATLSSVTQDAAQAIDTDNTTTAETSTSHTFPYLLVDLGRSMMVTKVSVLSGDDVSSTPLMNMDVRVGNSSNAGYDPNVKITNNVRCGVFFGPTLISNQWVEIDCGFKKGIYGRYLSLQLLERFGNGGLAISEVEVYGWGRTCNDDV